MDTPSKVESVDSSTALPPSVTISNLSFSDGTSVSLDPCDIIVLVGPNNSGKSVALKEIQNLFAKKEAKTSVIFDITISQNGSIEDVISLGSRLIHSQNATAAASRTADR